MEPPVSWLATLFSFLISYLSSANKRFLEQVELEASGWGGESKASY